MRVLGDVDQRALNAPRGSLTVVMEHGAACTNCGEPIAEGQQATFAWDNKRSAEPSRLHLDGRGSTTLKHKVCVTATTPASAVITGYKATSFDAWVASLPTLNATQRVILDLYRSRGPMTDEAMYEAYGALDPAAYRNTVLPARNALYKIGAVVDTGKRAQVKSGRTAIVWGLAQ